MTQLEVGTGQGPALVDWCAPGDGGSFLLALTHGAGGTVRAPDLLAARDAALRLGGAVALVTQPYRVRGARAPGPAGRQDEAWTEIMAWLRSGGSGGSGGCGGSGGSGGSGGRPAASRGPLTASRGLRGPLIVGGRSNGARVACRTAAAVDARGVIALAFPLQPPARRTRGSERPTLPPDRSAELRAAAQGGAHVLVLNGDRDPFGIPAGGGSTRVVVLKGETHSLSKKAAAVSTAVAAWLADVVLVVP